jgi:hypothetical protein
MITQQALLDLGYRMYRDHLVKLADALYQLRVYTEDKTETKLFVNVYYYKFNDRESWSMDNSFDCDPSLGCDYIHINVTLKNNMNPADIERLAVTLFERNGGINYGW